MMHSVCTQPLSQQLMLVRFLAQFSEPYYQLPFPGTKLQKQIQLYAAINLSDSSTLLFAIKQNEKPHNIKL